MFAIKYVIYMSIALSIDYHASIDWVSIYLQGLYDEADHGRRRLQQ